jgi:hypothetical protein
MPANRLRRKSRFTSYSKTFWGYRGQAFQVWAASLDVLVKQREAGGRAGRADFSATGQNNFRREVDPAGVRRIASGLGSSGR